MKQQLLNFILRRKEKFFFRTGSYDQINRNKLNKFIAEKKTGEKPSFRRPESLAIIIPCYCHSRYVLSTLQSAVCQTISPDEIIVVNDASPDASDEIITRWMHEIPIKAPELKTNLIYLSNIENKGQAYSLNRGIEHSRSDLIMILNDDDILMVDAVEAVLKIFRHNPEIAMFGGTCIPFTQDDNLKFHTESILALAPAIETDIRISYPDDAARYTQSNDVNMTHSSCTFFREVWKYAGGYQTSKNERIVPFSDRDFQLRINGLFPIGISWHVPFVFWREDSSVDAGRNS